MVDGDPCAFLLWNRVFFVLSVGLFMIAHLTIRSHCPGGGGERE
jgi:hypothetical protein